MFLGLFILHRLQWSVWLCHATTCLLAYVNSKGPDWPAHSVWLGSSLFAKRIIGYYRMYEWKAKARIIFCTCAGWSEYAHSSRKHTYIILTPLKPHFHIVKLGFTGVYIIFFFISAQNIVIKSKQNEYPQSMFWAEIWKISEFFIWKFSFFGGKIFSIFK